MTPAQVQRVIELISLLKLRKGDYLCTEVAALLQKLIS